MSDDDSTGDGPPDSRSHDVVETAVGALHALLGHRPEEPPFTTPEGPDEDTPDEASDPTANAD